MEFILQSFLIFAIGSTVLRITICPIARWLGLWHPRWDRYWLWFPWRPIYRLFNKAMRWHDEVFRMGKRSTGGWTNFLDNACMFYRPGQMYIGRLRALGFGMLLSLGMSGARHFMIIAGSQSGKSTLLTTQISLWQGNYFLIDPDGQISRTLPAKDEFTFDLNPYAFTRNAESACWNPFEVLEWVEDEWGLDACYAFAAKMAMALIMKESRNDPFWDDSPQKFSLGLILFIYAYVKEPEKRNLLTFRQYLTQGYGGANGFDRLLQDMQKTEAFNSAIARLANEFAQYDNDFRAKVLSSGIVKTAWIDNPKVQTTLTKSDFRLADLKKGKLKLRLSAPVGAINGELGPWFRIITMLALDLFEKIPGDMKTPCLFAIDEMPSLGHIEALESSAPVMSKFGVKLVCITQDIGLLKKVYPNSWEGFIGNAEGTIFVGVNHHETAEYVSKILGHHQIVSGKNKEIVQDRLLMDTEQVKRFLDPDRGNSIILRYGKRPMKTKNGKYFTELPVWEYEPDPNHKETLGRRIGRNFISRSNVFKPRKAPKLKGLKFKPPKIDILEYLPDILGKSISTGILILLICMIWNG